MQLVDETRSQNTFGTGFIGNRQIIVKEVFKLHRFSDVKPLILAYTVAELRVRKENVGNLKQSAFYKMALKFLRDRERSAQIQKQTHFCTGLIVHTGSRN